MYINKKIEDIIQDNSMSFSQYVIKHRALPDLYSGMKPIHLKILWSMFENKTFNFTKSANVSGKVMVYSPHGDCYETIVNMVQKDRHIYNLIEGQGNWGSSCSTELQFAASRYTETKLSLLGIDCMQGISKNMVEMINNYDNTQKMPKYLPTRLPLILCMASNGIAVGMANNSPSFNLEEVCNATISFIKGEEIPMLIPDFATGGYIIKEDSIIENINLNGIGSLKLRAKYEIEDNTILIKEIPYGTKISVESIIDKIIERCKNGELKEITNVLNLTGINGLCIEITCKKGVDMNKLMEKLYKLTPLESNFSANMNVLVEGSPMVLGVHDTIKKWVSFRQQCVRNGLQYDINKLRKELHLLHGLEKVLLDIDKAIDIIRHSDNVKEEMILYFNIDDIQVENIINMKLKNINKDYIIKQISDIKEMDNQLDKLKSVINSKEKINSIIIDDLKDVIKKFKQPRRTEILYEHEIDEISTDQLIEDYNTRLILTHENYLKKIPATSMRGSANIKLKEGDTIITELDSTNKSDILLFSNKQVCYKLYAWQLEDTKPSNLGIYLPQELQLDNDEKIIQIVSTTDYQGYLVFAFTNGKISKIDLSSYSTKTQRSKLLNAYANESELINMFYIKEDIDILCKSSINKVLITNTSLINPKSSKNSQGNMILKSKNDSYMDMCAPLDNIQGVEDTEYYRGKTNAVGSYLKKTDNISTIQLT